jgi:hypothetical protein
MSKMFSLNGLLAIDAITCAAMGALLMVAAGPVAALTALPAPFLFWAGAVLLPIAAFMALSASLRPVPAAAAALVVLGNIGWVIASLLLPALGFVTPNALGWIFLAEQAAVVAVLATLEAQAMQRSALAA